MKTNTAIGEHPSPSQFRKPIEISAEDGQCTVNPMDAEPETPQESNEAAKDYEFKVRRVVEPNRSELGDIINFEGRILTLPSGDLPITEAQAKYVALLDFPEGPVLVVSKSQAGSHEVSSVRSLLCRLGIDWSHEYLVGLDVIRTVYAGAGADFGSSGDNSVETVAMERIFVELISEASQKGASDIHVFVRGFETEIRFRINSLVSTHSELTALEGTELCQAAFAMADASDPTYTPNEQQGARINGGTLRSLNCKADVESLRLQFNPLAGGGRHMVVRLLYGRKVGNQGGIDSLGYCESQIAQIRKICRRTCGVNVVSGPTGSGKSTTLQRGLTEVMLERPGLTTLTIEDPPEYVIENAAQIPVTNANSAAERSEKFRSAIAGALRSDPDVIMIGEIRDESSAKLAFEAAMTGHAVWTTLHANSAMSIIDRLLDLNVDSFKLWEPSNISGLMAQRLVRLTRQDRSVPIGEGVEKRYISTEVADRLKEMAAESYDSIRLVDSHRDEEDFAGCFDERTVVAEVIMPDQSFLDRLRIGEKSSAIRHWKENLGGLTMLEHGFLRMLRGEIDPREIEEKVGFISDIGIERGQWIRDRMNEL